jgi:hypothetical protein
LRLLAFAASNIIFALSLAMSFIIVGLLVLGRREA